MPIVHEPIKYGEDNPIENAPELTGEELEIIKKRQEILDKLLADQGLAKYKIELNLGSGFSLHAPSHGALTFWESGKHFHGGGDAKLYLCPGKDRGMNGCEEFIPDPSQGYGFLLCPGCKNLWKGQEVAGEILARLSPEGWATIILKYFVRMGMNADLRIKMIREGKKDGDIRLAAKVEQDSRRGGEKLQVARQRHIRIYTLTSIIRDTSAGADLRGRILAFIKA